MPARKTKTILIIDTGNNNRSPLVHYVLEALLHVQGMDHIEVKSAGTHPKLQQQKRQDKPADFDNLYTFDAFSRKLPSALKNTWVTPDVLQDAKARFLMHRVQKCTPQMLRDADLVLFTDVENRNRVIEQLEGSSEHADLLEKINGPASLTAVGYGWKTNAVSELPKYLKPNGLKIPDPYESKTHPEYATNSIPSILVAHKVFTRVKGDPRFRFPIRV